MSEPRWNLIAHLRDQIDRDPERYANKAKLRVVAKKLAGLLNDPDGSKVLRLPEVEQRGRGGGAEQPPALGVRGLPPSA